MFVVKGKPWGWGQTWHRDQCHLECLTFVVLKGMTINIRCFSNCVSLFYSLITCELEIFRPTVVLYLGLNSFIECFISLPKCLSVNILFFVNWPPRLLFVSIAVWMYLSFVWHFDLLKCSTVSASELQFYQHAWFIHCKQGNYLSGNVREISGNWVELTKTSDKC